MLTILVKTTANTNTLVTILFFGFGICNSVRPILMSDIGHRRIGSNFTHRRSKGNCAPISDAPNLQRWVYDVAVSAARHKHIMRTRWSQNAAAWWHHCVGSVVGRSVGSGHPCFCPGDLQMRHPAVKSACNPIPVVMQSAVRQTVAACWLPLDSDVQAANACTQRCQLCSILSSI